MVEFWDDGRWRVISPGDSSFTWRTRDGEIASLDEVRADSTIFAQIFDRYPTYPYRFANPSHIRWEKLPRPVRGAVRAVMGPEAYEKAHTPRLYDRPRHLMLLVSIAAMIGSSALAWYLARLSAKRPAQIL